MSGVRTRPFVWKHSCTFHGESDGNPCDPPCSDPWNVDLPGNPGGSFANLRTALRFANLWAKLPKDVKEMPHD